MNNSEAISIGIIETLLPGVVMQYRQEQSNGEYDFNLIYKDGQIIPLEVTVSTDKAYEDMVAAIRAPRKGGSFVHAKFCRQGWYVFPAPNARVNNIKRHVDAYLADIEAEGRNSFFVDTDAQFSLAVARIFKDLGIEGGQVMKWKQPRLIGIALPSQQSTLDPQHLEQAVETEAHKYDNRQKLSKANAPEHHLFVYIEQTNYRAWHAINDAEPSSKLPRLPPEISHVWAAADSRKSDQYIVWRASVSERWTYAGTVTLTQEQIRSLKERAG